MYLDKTPIFEYNIIAVFIFNSRFDYKVFEMNKSIVFECFTHISIFVECIRNVRMGGGRLVAFNCWENLKDLSLSLFRKFSKGIRLVRYNGPGLVTNHEKITRPSLVWDKFKISRSRRIVRALTFELNSMHFHAYNVYCILKILFPHIMSNKCFVSQKKKKSLLITIILITISKERTCRGSKKNYLNITRLLCDS